MSEQQFRPRPFWFLRRRPEHVASDVDEELNTHLEMRVRELMARGLGERDARHEALRQFGDLEYTRQYCRLQDVQKETRMRRALALEEWIQDVRICRRSLRRAPVLTLTILATVGLGIGATTVIFTAVNAAFLRPLPYADSDRLVRIYTDAPPNRFRFSVADYLALEAQQTQFEGIAAYTNRAMAFSDGAVAERLRGREVTWSYLDVLGIRPLMGRDFARSDARHGTAPAVIVSYGFWQRRLGARNDALGSALRLDGRDHTLVGVLPAKTGPLEYDQEFFVVSQWDTPRRRGPFLYTVVARLRPDVSRATAAGELRTINRRIFPLWKSSYQDDKATWSMMDLKDHVVRDTGTIAGLALGAVALVWLLACANASNLLIARVTSRRRELAIRTALGASRGRVLKYLLVESGLLAVGAAAIGIVLTWVGLRGARSLEPASFPRVGEIAFDSVVAAVVAALTIISALLIGVVPAVSGTGGRLDESLHAEGRTATGNVRVRRVRRILVGAQFAIATPLVIVAVLLVASLNELSRVDVGFETQNLVSGSIALPAAQYSEPQRAELFWDALQRRLSALPGVTAVTFADGRAPAEVSNFNNFDLETSPTPPGQSPPVSPWVSVTPEYFQTLGLKLQQGRLLDDRDARRPAVESVVVDRAWTDRFFPGGSAVGKRFREGGCTACPWTTVVGVVSDVKYAGLNRPDEGAVYWPMAPDTLARFVIIRTRTDPENVIAAVSHSVREIDPSVPLSNVATGTELVTRSLEQPRSLALLVAAFAVVALALSVVGIYGVMAFYVQQHARDISIRLALGGQPGAVLKTIVIQGMIVVCSGVVVGALAAMTLTPLFSSLLFGVAAIDPMAFAGVSVMLLAVALAACAIPAKRAVAAGAAAVLRTD